MLEEGLDTGQVIEKRYLAINANETAWELYQRVDMLCFEMFKDQIGNILSGQYTTEEQDLSLPSRIYERTSLEQKEVDLTWEHDKIWNFVRGMEFKPFQPACIMIKGNRKIYLTTKVNTDE